MNFFTYGSDVLLSPITRIFNVCLSNGLFPSRWSEGLIVPLYKKGDVNVASNYRGITLLSVFGKLYTKLINNRLNKWAECYEILIEAQAGFRKSYSTVDQIFALNGIISHILNTKKQLCSVFVDFRRAFDSVNRKCLWYKMTKSGIRGNMFNVITSTVQITFIFIDFRVCDFAFAFKTQNAPCVSRFKRVLFSDRFQFAF